MRHIQKHAGFVTMPHGCCPWLCCRWGSLTHSAYFGVLSSGFVTHRGGRMTTLELIDGAGVVQLVPPGFLSAL